MDDDFVRLSQVLPNLIHNHFNFTDPGGAIDVCISTEGREAIVQVRVTGTGIDSTLSRRLFDIFTLGKHLNAGGQVGLGLGLTLSRRLVEMRGGSISAHSAGLGMGSTFTIRLPKLNVRGATSLPLTSIN